MPDRRIANAFPRQHERATSTGACVAGYADGTGVLEWYVDDSLTQRCEGEPRRGVKQSHGKTSCTATHASYDGEYRDGKVHYPDGMDDEAEFAHGWRKGPPIPIQVPLIPDARL